MYRCFCFYILLKRLVVNVSYISIFVLMSCSSVKIFLITDFRENWRFMYMSYSTYFDMFRLVAEHIPSPICYIIAIEAQAVILRLKIVTSRRFDQVCNL